jgi:hypothetical protein
MRANTLRAILLDVASDNLIGGKESLRVKLTMAVVCKQIIILQIDGTTTEAMIFLMGKNYEVFNSILRYDQNEMSSDLVMGRSAEQTLEKWENNEIGYFTWLPSRGGLQCLYVSGASRFQLVAAHRIFKEKSSRA